MKLLAVNVYQHLGHRFSSVRLLSNQDKAELLKGLEEVERAVRPLRKVKHAGRLAAGQKDDCDRFRGLLSLDCPRSVYSLEPGWYDELKNCVDHDRQLLTQNGAAAAKPLQIAALRNGCSLGLRFSEQWGEEEADGAAFLPQEVVDSYRSLAATPSHESWNSHLAALIGKQFRRCRLTGMGLLFVEIREQECGHPLPNHAVVVARVRDWSLADAHRRGLRIDVDARAANSATRSLQAEMFLEIHASPSHTFSLTRNHNGTPTNHVRERLRSGEPGSRGFLLQVANVLRRLALTPRHRPWPQVLKEAESVTGAWAKPVSPCLLAELAYHREQIATAPPPAPANLLKALPAIVAAADWRTVVECVGAAAVPLMTPPATLDAVYRKTVDRAPREPESGDLDWLLQTAEAWQVNLGAVGPLAAALGRFGQQCPLPANVRRLLRQLLLQPPQVLAHESFGPVWEFLGRCLRDAEDAELADVIRGLAGPLEAVHQGGIPRNGSSTSDTSVRNVLESRVPNPDPGVWQTADQHPAFLNALNAFEGLVSALGVQAWDPKLLTAAREPLPRLPGESEPSRYPSSFWHIIRLWLRQDKERPTNWDCYLLDVASWLARRYLCFAAFGYPGTSPACLAALEDQLRRLGGWFRHHNASHSVYEAFAATLIAQLSGPDAELDQVGRLLACISPRKDKKWIATTAAKLLPMRPWLCGLGDRFRGFLADVLASEGEQPLEDLIRLTLLGLGRAEPGDVQEWSRILKAIVPDPKSHRAAVDTCLAEWDTLIQSGIPVEAMAEKLAHLAAWLGGNGWLKRMSGRRDLYARWRDWIGRWRKASEGGEGATLFPERAQLLVLSASLRSHHGLLQQHIGRLCPAVPGWLLLQKKYPLFHQLIGLAHRSGVVMTPTMVNALGVEVAAALVSRKPSTDTTNQVLKLLEAWTRLPSTDAGPGVVIRTLWPTFPACWIAAGEDARIERFRDVCRKSSVTWTEAMQTSLASHIMTAATTTAQGVPLALQLNLLAKLVDTHRGELWNQIAPIAVTDGDLGKEEVLCFAAAIFSSPAQRARQMFREEAWRQADACRKSNPQLARRLANLALS